MMHYDLLFKTKLPDHYIGCTNKQSLNRVVAPVKGTMKLRKIRGKRKGGKNKVKEGVTERKRVKKEEERKRESRERL